MKYLSILLLSLLCVCCSQPEERVIEYPPYVIRSKSAIDISKIEVKDSCTVLHLYANYTPSYWMKISAEASLTDDNGKVYTVLSGNGITLGEHFMMPESGEKEFQLVFPPLDKGVVSVDFDENADSGFKIWGIRLDGKLPKLKIPKWLKTDDGMYTEALPQNKLEYGTATVQGKVLDYRPSMGDKLRFVVNEAVRNMSKIVYADIQADGSYKAEFELTAPAQISLSLAGNVIWAMAEPGKTIQVYINMREEGRRESEFHADGSSYGELAYTDSPWGTVMKEYQKYSMEVYNYRSSQNALDYEALADMDMRAYKEYQLQMYAELQSIIDTLPVCPAARDILTFDNHMNAFTSLYQAPGNISYAQYQLGKINREQLDAVQQKLLAEWPENYIDEAYLEEMSDSHYLPFLRGYMAEYAGKVMELQRIDSAKYQVLPAIAQTYMWMSYISIRVPLTDEQKAQLKNLPKAYEEVLTVANDELLALLEAERKKSGYTIHEADSFADENLFESIIGQWRGKVIMVDLWGTGCAPCISGHENMAPVKEELKDADIVWLYIADPNSPETSWKNYLPNIPGEHYRLNTSQWKQILKELELDGAIPTYLIVDRDGSVKYKQVGFYGADQLKAELMKVLG